MYDSVISVPSYVYIVGINVVRIGFVLDGLEHDARVVICK